MDEGDHPKAMEAMKKSVTVSHDMAVALMKKCREKNFNYLISPYESDSQLTYLQKIDIIDFIMSEDSDLLVFGDPEFSTSGGYHKYIWKYVEYIGDVQYIEGGYHDSSGEI